MIKVDSQCFKHTLQIVKIALFLDSDLITPVASFSTGGFLIRFDRTTNIHMIKNDAFLNCGLCIQKVSLIRLLRMHVLLQKQDLPSQNGNFLWCRLNQRGLFMNKLSLVKQQLPEKRNK